MNAVAKDLVVQIAYVLRDTAGTILDEANVQDDFVYLHGHSNIVPGLEKALEGQSPGSKIKVSLTPDEGYGDFDPKLVRRVHKSEFPAEFRKVKEGELLQIEEDGHWQVHRVDKVEKDHLVLDGNHELAGQDLHFEVEIVAIRAPLAEELEHGHAHAHGHHHH